MPLNPFLYPQARHRRRWQPPSYAAYARYKPFLKQEFMSQCVYCRLPNGLKGEDSFGVDHYRPQSKFPELATTYTNLFYACNCCNRRKGPFWPTDTQWQAQRFIPNPCEHVMFDHLRYHGVHVETRTPAGELAERVLMLNDEDTVQYREFVREVIAALEGKKRRLQETLQSIDRLLATYSEQANQLTAERESAAKDLATLQCHLSRVTGTGSL